MPRPRKTELQLETAREHILDAAYAILNKEGPEAITIRAIAERLGVAHMGLYTYFENQAAILRALSERELARWRERRGTLEKRAHLDDIAAVVRDTLRFYVDFARENPNLFRLAWVTPEAGGESAAQTRLRMQETVGQLAGLVKLGIDRGVFEPRDPLAAAVTVLSMVNMPHILFHSGRMADPKMRDRVVEETLIAAMLYLKRQ